jgi:Xaa-Pro aminopeptidase
MKSNMTTPRLSKLRESMGDCDAIVASSLENTYYFSGSYITTIRSIPDRLALLLVPKEGEPTFLVCVIEESLVRKESPIADIRGYVEFGENPVDLLGKVLRERGLDRATIGFEAKHISAAYRERLNRVTPYVAWRPVDDMLGRLRAIKSHQEIEALSRGALATEAAIMDGWDSARPGRTERAVALEMVNGMMSRGLDIVSFLCLGAGSHCGDAHPTPSARKLAKGEIIRCDVGGIFQRYQTDVARTAVFGKPTPKQARRYEAIYEAQRRVVLAMKPGTPVSELWKLAADTVKSYDLPFTAPHIGHSIGIGLHEEPMIQPFNQATLEEGMVFYVEPFIHLGPRDAYHVEDLVLVTPDGGLVLTDQHGRRGELLVL